MITYKGKTFPERNHRIQMRFNNEHTTDNDAWRLIVDGVEHIVASIKVETVVDTKLFMKEGILKGNIETSGWPTIYEDGSAVVKGCTQ